MHRCNNALPRLDFPGPCARVRAICRPTVHVRPIRSLCARRPAARPLLDVGLKGAQALVPSCREGQVVPCRDTQVVDGGTPGIRLTQYHSTHRAHKAFYYKVLMIL